MVQVKPASLAIKNVASKNADAIVKALAERTLTKLYNQRPAWLDGAHQALDLAVAHAYGWADYTPAMPDEEILKRLLALNLARAVPHGKDAGIVQK
jgi:hypothetical protein